MEAEFTYNVDIAASANATINHSNGSASLQYPSLLNMHRNHLLKSSDHQAFHADQPAPHLQQLHPPATPPADPLDLRFSILRQLLPSGSELQERDDILKVVFDYVRTLESEIQNFNGGLDTASDGMGALQKKGLCIVQLSELTNSI